MKTCTKCKVLKQDESFFYRDKKQNKRQSHCKDCCKEHRKKVSRDHYIKYKAEYMARSAKNSIKVKALNRKNMLEYLEGKSCMDCGEANRITLEFDHRNPKEKKKGVAQMMNYSWNSILKEIDKCDLVCKNCHAIRTAMQNGSYRLYS